MVLPSHLLFVKQKIFFFSFLYTHCQSDLSESHSTSALQSLVVSHILYMSTPLFLTLSQFFHSSGSQSGFSNNGSKTSAKHAKHHNRKVKKVTAIKWRIFITTSYFKRLLPQRVAYFNPFWGKIRSYARFSCLPRAISLTFATNETRFLLCKFWFWNLEWMRKRIIPANQPILLA